MKIRCPQCLRISEIPHVEHGRIAVCACQATFRIDGSTVVEEFSLPDLPPPEFIGRYSIVRYLGRGASNCVYEGIHPDLGVPVAIKTLLPEYAADRPSREQFLHAAKIYAKAVHPNIVKVYEAGRDANGVPFLAMEFLPGGSLADRIQNNQRFSAKEVAGIGAEISRALVVTAGLGIVHRDIKPDNIMLSADGKHKLADLGLAKLDPSSASGNGACVLDENNPAKATRKTSFGTLEYMSPEQYIDTESCDIRSDIYSLGVTMYQLAAGRLPFETQTRSELRHMHISVEPLVPSTYVHDIPIDFDYIVMHCIQKRPEDRYHTPEELLADLEAFLADAPLPSTTSGAVPFVRPSALISNTRKKRSILLPVTAAVLILLILAGTVLLFLTERAKAGQRTKLLQPPVESVQKISPDVEPPPQADSSDSSSHLTQKELDAEITIGGADIDTQAAGLFEEMKEAFERVRKEHSGYNEVIENLGNFDMSDRPAAEDPVQLSDEGKKQLALREQRSQEARAMIFELKRERDKAVGELMNSLKAKADPLIDAGNFDGAISIYSFDIGPLEPESEPARKKEISKLEGMRRDAELGLGPKRESERESEPESVENVPEEEFLP